MKTNLNHILGVWRLERLRSTVLAVLTLCGAGGALAQTPAQPVVLTPVAAPAVSAPKSTKHEVSASGDFMMGQGTVTLPVGYSLRESLKASGVDLNALPAAAPAKADRDSLYYGATISYSYGQAWYLDLSYARGSSSGNQSVSGGWLGDFDNKFEIDDEWYQAYIRYTFPKLRGKPFSAYLRLGASFVQADLVAESEDPATGRYRQNDETQDILGNLGFGLSYSLYASRRVRMWAQFEGEGFYGSRTQDSLEILRADEGLVFKNASIDNTLFGGIGRLTLRLEYRPGRSGLFRIFGDIGAQMRYTSINYPEGGGTVSELLWGPYARLGVRYSF